MATSSPSPLPPGLSPRQFAAALHDFEAALSVRQITLVRRVVESFGLDYSGDIIMPRSALQ